MPPIVQFNETVDCRRCSSGLARRDRVISAGLRRSCRTAVDGPMIYASTIECEFVNLDPREITKVVVNNGEASKSLTP